MFGIFSNRVSRATSQRAMLSLHSLELRDQPSSLLETPEVFQIPFSSKGYFQPRNQQPGQGQGPNLPPVITEMWAPEVGLGVFHITGHVDDESPAGMVIRFGGIPSMQGKTATVDADGNFSLVVTLKLDGSDVGTISAITTDNQGLDSEIFTVFVSP